MGAKPDYVRKKFEPQKQRTLQAALAHRIGVEFPRLGPRLRDTCAEMVVEVVAEHLRPREEVRHGQVVWMAYSRDDPPSRGKTAAQTDMVAVVLDLACPEDVDAVIDRIAPDERLLRRALRLCRQTYEQGGLLSNVDLSFLLGFADNRISRVIVSHEKLTGQVVPRRATIHDVGTGLTHKHIICLKRYREGKTSDLIARETLHSIEAVDRYLGQFDRVRHCRQQGMDVNETAHILSCGVSLVRQYLEIDDELGANHD